MCTTLGNVVRPQARSPDEDHMLRELLHHFGERLRLLDGEVMAMGARQAEVGHRVNGFDERLQNLANMHNESFQEASNNTSGLLERVSRIERRQKAVIVSAQRALEAALEAKKQHEVLSQRHLQQERLHQYEHSQSRHPKNPELEQRSVSSEDQEPVPPGEVRLQRHHQTGCQAQTLDDEVVESDGQDEPWDVAGRAAFVADRAWNAARRGTGDDGAGRGGCARLNVLNGSWPAAVAAAAVQAVANSARAAAETSDLKSFEASERIKPALEPIQEDAPQFPDFSEAVRTSQPSMMSVAMGEATPSPAAWRQRRRRLFMSQAALDAQEHDGTAACDDFGMAVGGSPVEQGNGSPSLLSPMSFQRLSSASSSSPPPPRTVVSTTSVEGARGGKGKVAPVAAVTESSVGDADADARGSPSRDDERSRSPVSLSPSTTAALLDGWAGMIVQTLEARLDYGLKDVEKRIDHLQQTVEQEAVRSVSSRLPEALRRIDGLAEQCQDLEAKRHEFEVRLDMLRATVEGHDQQLLLCNRRSVNSVISPSQLSSLLAEGPAMLQQESGGDAAAGAEALASKVDMHMQTISKLCQKLQS